MKFIIVLLLYYFWWLCSIYGKEYWFSTYDINFPFVHKKSTIVLIQMAELKRNKGSQCRIHNSQILKALKNKVF